MSSNLAKAAMAALFIALFATNVVGWWIVQEYSAATLCAR